MKTVLLDGGLANQMTQYIFARCVQEAQPDGGAAGKRVTAGGRRLAGAAVRTLAKQRQAALYALTKGTVPLEWPLLLFLRANPPHLGKMRKTCLPPQGKRDILD